MQKGKRRYKNPAWVAVGKHLSKARDDANYTQTEAAAELSDIDLRTLQRHEYAEQDTAPDRLLSFARLYKNRTLPIKCYTENVIWKYYKFPKPDFDNVAKAAAICAHTSEVMSGEQKTLLKIAGKGMETCTADEWATLRPLLEDMLSGVIVLLAQGAPRKEGPT